MSPSAGNSRRVLVFAPIGRDGAASVELLRRGGLEAESCPDLSALVEQMDQDTGAVFLAEEGLFGRDYRPLHEWISAQPPWSDLPFIILTSEQQHPSIFGWRRRLMEALRNVSLLERPIQAITLMSAIQTALRARGRQYEVRDLLLARERAAVQLEALVAERTRKLAETNAELRREMSVREQAEESLRQAQKMEALGQLTGGVAHDFNNLLTVLSAGLQMLNRSSNADRRDQIADAMRQAIDRGARLTRQLLAFSRKTDLSPRPMNLSAHIGGMRELLERSLRGDISIKLEVGEELWPVEVDHGELELAILNLAVNARDAMPSGGAITIRCKNVAGSESPLAGDFVEVAVQDTGTGMTDEVRQRVFEPFFTTKDIGKGSGLGLAQVYGFARQSRGNVSIESQLGVGTVVSLLLPRSAKIPPEPDSVPLSYGQGTREGSAGNVLLVEDDNEVAALVAEMLQELGYRVLRASDAQAALGALANGRKVDLVFSDIMMPGGMSGIELAKIIRVRRPGLPIVLTSGYVGTSGSVSSPGSDIALLQKPYQLSELDEKLRSALDRRPGAGTGARPG